MCISKNLKRVLSRRYDYEKEPNFAMFYHSGICFSLDTFLETVRRYTNATEITQRMVAELIDHIDVYHAEKQDGVTTQHMTMRSVLIGFEYPCGTLRIIFAQNPIRRSIRLEFLERVVLYKVNRLACFANEYKDDAMMGRSAKVTENKRSRKQDLE